MDAKEFQALQVHSISELKKMKNIKGNPVTDKYYDQVITMKKEQNRANQQKLI